MTENTVQLLKAEGVVPEMLFKFWLRRRANSHA